MTHGAGTRASTAAKVVRLGAFVVLTVGLTVWIGATIVGVDTGSRYTLHATFDDVANLRSGDDVKLAGVVVGEVGGIDVERGRAIVRFAIDDEVALPVDSAVSVRWRNLIGQRYLAVEPGTSAEHFADGDEVLDAGNVVDLGQLVNQLAPLAQAVSPDELNRILRTVVEAFDGNAATFDSLLGDFDALLATLAERDTTIAQLLDDYATITDALARRDQQLGSMVENLAAIAGTFAANDALLDQALTEFAGFSTNLDAYLGASAADFGATLDSLAVLTGTAAGNIDGLEAALNNLPEVFEALWPAVNHGAWLRVSMLCVTLNPGPCPYPMAISDAGGGLRFSGDG